MGVGGDWEGREDIGVGEEEMCLLGCGEKVDVFWCFAEDEFDRADFLFRLGQYSTLKLSPLFIDT